MKRDCVCPRARHEHGQYRAYQDDRCRCELCKAANSARLRRYRMTRARNAWNGGSAWTDSTGARRRIQALSAAGWSLTQLAPHLGMGASGVGWLRAAEGRCLTATAAKVAVVYDELWHVTPTGGAVERTAAWAERRGWAAPWQWEDVDIDDPAATPRACSTPVVLDEVAMERRINGDHQPLTIPELAEAVLILHARGWSETAIAKRLRMSGTRVTQIIDRDEAA